MDQVFYMVAFFIAGAVFGSFLNVCAYRIPRKESVSFPPSHCTSCNKAIRPYDNIPILSYAILRGRCRDCGERISIRYPLVEAVIGILWATAYIHSGLTYRTLAIIFFTTVVVLLSIIDIDTKTIPNKILIPSMAISAAVASLYVVNINLVPIYSGYNGFWAFGGMFLGAGILLAIAILGSVLFKKEAMGIGDVKLAAFIGLFIGAYVIMALFIGFFVGSVVSIALIITKKVGKKDYVPFGPFLGVGAIITVYFGPQIWDAYLKLVGM
jgi:leader peptidase (prepilin peptidase) / N-methyltransferase